MPLKQAETTTPRNNLTNDGQALRRETPKYVRDTEEHGAGQYPPMFRAGTLHGKGAEETLRRPASQFSSAHEVKAHEEVGLLRKSTAPHSNTVF